MSFTSPKFNIEHLPKSGFFNKNLPVPLNLKSTRFYLYGRNALYSILWELKQQHSFKKVLFPAYICGDEVEAAINAGYNPDFFHVKSDFEIDMDDLYSKLINFGGVLIVIHYFGFCQKNIEFISNYCKKNKIVLIEDCAYCFGSAHNNKALGTYGDFSIFSLRKHLPIPHGGALVLNNKNLIKKFVGDYEAPSQSAVNMDFFTYLAYETGVLKYGENVDYNVKVLTNIKQGLFGPRLEKFGGYNLLLSKLCTNLISKISHSSCVSDIMGDRVRNYKYYLDIFKSKTSFYPLKKGDIPVIFPIHTKNAGKIHNYCLKNNIGYLQPIWNHIYPIINRKRYSRELSLKKNLLGISTLHRAKKKELVEISKMI
jgi:hypothetical protein